MAIEVTSFRPLVKNSLRGFLTLRLTNVGMEIRDASLNEKENRRWIGLPARSYQADGKTRWTAIIDFFDKPKGEVFQKAALAALDQFMKKGQGDGGF